MNPAVIRPSPFVLIKAQHRASVFNISLAQKHRRAHIQHSREQIEVQQPSATDIVSWRATYLQRTSTSTTVTNHFHISLSRFDCVWLFLQFIRFFNTSSLFWNFHTFYFIVYECKFHTSLSLWLVRQLLLASSNNTRTFSKIDISLMYCICFPPIPTYNPVFGSERKNKGKERQKSRRKDIKCSKTRKIFPIILNNIAFTALRTFILSHVTHRPSLSTSAPLKSTWSGQLNDFLTQYITIGTTSSLIITWHCKLWIHNAYCSYW